MNKYDKVWVPSTSPHSTESRAICGYQYKPISNVIVLTRDEAFDLWMAAMDYCDQFDGKKDFAAYLQSKGIYID